MQSAIAKGLMQINFLEHLEEGILSQQKTWLDQDDFDHYFAEGRRLEKLYSGDIEVRLGVECGYNPRTV